jgi:hypothetical protein
MANERLTFEQREGAAELPRQLKPKEVSQELRALLWRMFDGWIKPQYASTGGFDPWLDDRWRAVFHDLWSLRDHEVAEFENSYKLHVGRLRKVIADGTYVELFGLLEWMMRHGGGPPQFNRNIAFALERSRSAYRVVGGDTIMPITDPVEAETVDRAFADLADSTLSAPRRHLKLGVEQLAAGNWADSIRESVHAVEATARILAPGAKELTPALRKLEESARIHGALKAGFSSIYGFTSDEQGVRHPLVDDPQAKVDEVDALFMLGACASFVSYLIGKVRNHGKS